MNPPNNNLIGIPTVDGMEYIDVHKIIQCEGLQACTRVITTDRPNIISSYCIGKFLKLLQPFGFYSPHKSYIINLRHVKRYGKEGIITLTDKHHVPVSRRRKTEFLGLIPHI